MTPRDRVVRLIAAELGVAVERVTPDAHLADDLGADSLDQVELVAALADAFDIAIADKDAVRLTTVGAVMIFVGDR